MTTLLELAENPKTAHFRMHINSKTTVTTVSLSAVAQ